MTEGTFENKDENAEGRDGSSIQDDIETKAEDANDSSPDQHLGDAMDDVNLEPPSS